MEEPHGTPPLKIEPRYSPLPTPHSSVPEHPHTNPVDNTSLQKLLSVGREINLGRSMLKRTHQNNDRGSTSIGHRSTMEPRESSPKRAHHENDRTSTSPVFIPEGYRAASSVIDLEEASFNLDHQEPFDPFADNPAYGKDPRLTFAELDHDQKRVVDLASRKRKNICCVGGAGTGKSRTCEVIVNEFADTGIRVAIVAPSGTSAVNVRAQTLHSFFGLGASTNKGEKELVRRMKPTVRERISSHEVLIIDEISMVSYETFDRMDRLAKAAHNEQNKPFGGMQLIVFGDFCQLPPVKPYEHCFECGKKRELVSPAKQKRGKKLPKVWQCPDHEGKIHHDDKMWAFKSAEWAKVDFVYTPLNQVHRQQDPTFLAVLANVRYGKPFTSREVELLNNHECDVTNAVELVPRRDEATRINRRQLERLAGVAHEYECQDDFMWKRDLHPELDHIKQNARRGLQEHPYEELVRLKQGQPVILQRNLNVKRGLVNGSQGVIDHFVDYNNADQQRGSSLEDGDISILRTNHVKDFMRDQRRNNLSTKIPVVRFNNYPDLVPILPDCSVEELGFKTPHSLLMRTQIPLLAGWALTIHKAQGMTLEKAIVQLECFTSGMAYVALSRVKTLKGLKVLDLTATSAVHPMDDEVKAFLQLNFGARFD